MLPSRRWPDWLTPVIILMLAGHGIALLALAADWPMCQDASYLNFIAWRLTQGDAPYRDLFDVNFPGAYLLHMLMVNLPGTWDGRTRAVETLLIVVNVAMAWRLMTPAPAVWRAAAATVYVSAQWVAGPWNAVQRETFILALALGAGLAVLRWAGRRSATALVVAGVLAGAASTVKPHAGLLVLILAAVVWRSGRELPAGQRRCSLGILMAAATLPWLAVLVWLAGVGSLMAFFDILWHYTLPLYGGIADLQGQSGPGRLYFLLCRAFQEAPLPALVLLGGFVTWSAWRSRQAPTAELVRTGLLAFGLLMAVGQMKGWSYHWFIFNLAAPMVILHWLAGQWVRPELELRRGLWLALAGVVVLPLVLRSSALVWYSPDWPAGEVLARKAQRSQTLAEMLTRDAQAQGIAAPVVQVLDTIEGGAHVMLLLHARPATRFLNDFHFLAHDPQSPVVQALRTQLMAALAEHPPDYVLLYQRGWPRGDYDRLEQFPALRTWLTSHYGLLGEMPGYCRVFGRQTQPTNPPNSR